MWKDRIKKKTGDTMGRPVRTDKVDLIGKYKLVKKLRMINQELQLIGEDVLDNVIDGSKDLRELDMDSEDIIRFFSILSQALLRESQQMESL